jgi:hypothetical protein
MARARALLFELFAQFDDELAGIAGNGFGRSNGLSKASLDLDDLLKPDRLDGFTDSAEGLVDAPAQ